MLFVCLFVFPQFFSEVFSAWCTKQKNYKSKLGETKLTVKYRLCYFVGSVLNKLLNIKDQPKEIMVWSFGKACDSQKK